jgi:hypothetical protein
MQSTYCQTAFNQAATDDLDLAPMGFPGFSLRPDGTLWNHRGRQPARVRTFPEGADVVAYPVIKCKPVRINVTALVSRHFRDAKRTTPAPAARRQLPDPKPAAPKVAPREDSVYCLPRDLFPARTFAFIPRCNEEVRLEIAARRQSKRLRPDECAAAAGVTLAEWNEIEHGPRRLTFFDMALAKSGLGDKECIPYA